MPFSLCAATQIDNTCATQHDATASLAIAADKLSCGTSDKTAAVADVAPTCASTLIDESVTILHDSAASPGLDTHVFPQSAICASTLIDETASTPVESMPNSKVQACMGPFRSA